MKYSPAELDDLLLRVRHGAQLIVRCASPEAARRVKWALYHRRKTTPVAMTIKLRGAELTLIPTQDPILTVETTDVE